MSLGKFIFMAALAALCSCTKGNNKQQTLTVSDGGTTGMSSGSVACSNCSICPYPCHSLPPPASPQPSPPGSSAFGTPPPPSVQGNCPPGAGGGPCCQQPQQQYYSPPSPYTYVPPDNYSASPALFVNHFGIGAAVLLLSFGAYILLV